MTKDFQYTALIVQRRMTHYRIPFFESLRHELGERGCRLRLAYGAPSADELRKQDSGDIAWAKKLNTRYLFDGRLCWQPFAEQLFGVDLAVLTLENKLLYNLASQFLHKHYRVALWGHGANLQGDKASLRERFKQIVAKRADWWFGYSAMSVPLIERSGFPTDRITVLNNSVDTRALAAMHKAVQPEELVQLHAELGLGNGPIGVFIGSLYEEKRIDFILDAVVKIRYHIPDFQFLIVGAGPQKDLVERFCLRHSWIKYLGMLKGQDKVNVLALAHVLINPGVVGLGVLDSFACGVPLLTTNCSGHGPEIAYLRDRENGLMTSNTLDDYVSAVVSLLLDEKAMSRLKEGCYMSAEQYTVENMARNFADGVMHCLELPIYRGRG